MITLRMNRHIARRCRLANAGRMGAAQATWIAWPHQLDDWPGKFEPIPWVYVEIVRRLQASEDVHILVNDTVGEDQARRHLAQVGRDLQGGCDFFSCPPTEFGRATYGPIFSSTSSGRLAVTDWHFNAWAKYPNWQNDAKISSRDGRRAGSSLLATDGLAPVAWSWKAAASTSTVRACC